MRINRSWQPQIDAANALSNAAYNAAIAVNASPKGVYATVTALTAAFPTGNADIYLVTADGKWYYWNGSAWTAGTVYQATADSSVTPKKTNFITDCNLYDSSVGTVGSIHLSDDGSLYSSGSYTGSDFIPVIKRKIYYAQSTATERMHVAFWKSDKTTFISGLYPVVSGNALTITASSDIDVAYMTIGVPNTQKSSLVVWDYLAGNYSFLKKILSSDIRFDAVIDKTALPAIVLADLPTITAEKTDFFSKIVQLFVSGDVIPNGYYIYDSGVWHSDVNYASTGFIEVEPGYLYDCSSSSSNIGHATFWDKDHNYVSGINPLTKVGNIYTITVTSNTRIKYMKIMTTTSEMPSMLIVPHVILARLSNQIKTVDVHNLDTIVDGLKADTADVDADLQAFKSDVGSSTVIGAQWSGKKWYAYGTSLTSPAQGKYVTPLASLSGLVAVNEGAGGACLHTIYGNLTSSGYADADLVTIEGSVNDYNTAIPLGNVGDTTVYNATGPTGSFAGSVYSCIQKAFQIATNATIVCITDPAGHHPNGGGDFDPSATNSLGLKQIDYINMMIAVCEYLGVPVIKAGQTGSINLFNPQYYVDHIHQTDLGGQQYANAIWDDLKNIHCRIVA